MKIEVEKIKKDQELRLEEEVLAKTWDLDSFDVKFVGSISFDCIFRRIGDEILVGVNVVTHRSITCSRCLADTTQAVKQEFELSYSATELGDYLEVDKDIREEILLNFPMKVLCKDNCKGICPVCKANLNLEKCKCQENQKSKCKNQKHTSKSKNFDI